MSLRVGVIGTGMIGQDQSVASPQVLSGVEVVAVSDIDRDRAKAASPEGAEVFEHAAGTDPFGPGAGGGNLFLGSRARGATSGVHRRRQAGLLREAAGDLRGALPYG